MVHYILDLTAQFQHAHNLLSLINSLYKLRDCKLNLTKNNIEKGIFKPCLNLHIKKCFAPCINNISEEDYNLQIINIAKILRGNTKELIKEYKLQMQKCSATLNFEQAQIYKEKTTLLQNHYSKSLIVNPSITNTDVFSIVFEKNNAFGNFFRLHDGCIIQAINLHFKLNIEEEKDAVLTRFMHEIYQLISTQKLETPQEILVPFLPDNTSIWKNVHIPLKGDKLNLLELSTKNATAFCFQKMKQESLKNPTENENRSVLALKEALRMEKMPLHIECFDNSNIQGTNPVASCVVFKNGKPSKKDYRHFNIKTVIGANDFASMKEVVFRRYSRLLSENMPLPQLILIDGGKGQLNFAYQALEDLNLNNKIEIIGIAKRLEEIVIPGDPTPLFLDKNSPALKLLMQLRDEAHRFGITHHRKKRSKGQVSSELLEIKGVGEITQQKLIQHFKSVKRIKCASKEEIEKIIGKKMADLIIKGLSLPN